MLNMWRSEVRYRILSTLLACLNHNSLLTSFIGNPKRQFCGKEVEELKQNVTNNEDETLTYKCCNDNSKPHLSFKCEHKYSSSI